MKLIDYFNNARIYEDYENLLQENLPLHRLHYKKFQISDTNLSLIQKTGPIKILVITESFCGDSLALLPIVRKLSEVTDDWEIKIALRDENPNLMDQFLTDGTRSIPIFLFLDFRGELLFKWGPRPQKAQEIYEDHRDQIESGEIEKKSVIKKIRQFYAKDRGNHASDELLKKIQKNLKKSVIKK